MSLFSIFSTTINFDDQPLFSVFTDSANKEATDLAKNPDGLLSEHSLASIFKEVAKPNSENLKKLIITVVAVFGVAAVTIVVSRHIAKKRKNRYITQMNKRNKTRKNGNIDIPDQIHKGAMH